MAGVVLHLQMEAVVLDYGLLALGVPVSSGGGRNRRLVLFYLHPVNAKRLSFALCFF